MCDNVIEGLLVKGSIAGRSRRIVGDKKIELVTYKIIAGNKVFFVKEWEPKEYFPVGQTVELPISIKPFEKNGRVSVDYTIRGCSVLGEEF